MRFLICSVLAVAMILGVSFTASEAAPNKSGHGHSNGHHGGNHHNHHNSHNPHHHGKVHRGHHYRHNCYRHTWRGYSRSCWSSRHGCQIYWCNVECCWYRYIVADQIYVPCED
jgi:hypothetical protein